MKSVLLSIHPQWCELIASGRKTIEVRRTRPKIETPFKCYIYMTSKGNKPIKEIETPNGFAYVEVDYKMAGKVMGEFVCDRIYDIEPHDDGHGVNQYTFVGADYDDCKTGLSFEELKEYLGGNIGYAWHISELKIYDKPKELYDFRPWCEKIRKTDDNLEMCCNCKNAFFDEDGAFYGCGLTRPPQSRCYVEELQ